MPTKDDLKLLQNLPLEIKIAKTKLRIREWIDYYGTDGVYVSFSGGKDSTVLLHIVRSMYPNVEAVFVNTGLEYPEIQKFVKNFDNVTILRPEMRFDEVIKKYGYPILSKEISEIVSQARVHISNKTEKYSYRLKQLNGERVDKNGKPCFNHSKYKPLLYTDFLVSHSCCVVMKKQPIKKYEKQQGKTPITAQMAEESILRQKQWIRSGCNAFERKRPVSNPMSFWTEQDVLQYINQYNIPIASVYGEVVYAEEPDQIRFAGCEGGKLKTTGCDRTGCVFCAFGAHIRGDKRFQRLKETHPKQYEYCIGGGEYVDGIWQPNKQGLGMGHVFDELNKIYGDGFIKY